MAGTSYKGSEIKSIDQFLTDKDGLSSSREKDSISVTDTM